MSDSALNKALKWGLVTRNAADRADAPRPKRQSMKIWDQAQVQAFLAHSSITLTLDTYSHVIPTLQREAAKKMNDLLV